MTYVWIQESAGSMRYVDDIYLPPCNKCGKRLSECPKHEEEIEAESDEVSDECPSCNGACRCDAIYDAQKEREVDDYYEAKG